MSENCPEQVIFRRSLARAVALPPLAMVLLAGVFLGQLVRLLSMTEWVDRTDTIIARSQHTWKLLVDMETGLRGYLLTGVPDFLEPYTSAGATIDSELDGLGRLVADDPAQGGQLETLRSQYDEWHRYAREMIELRERGGEYQGREVNARGKAMMDALRDRLTAFIGVERALRADQFRAAQWATRLVIAVSTGSALLLGGIIALAARRQLIALSRAYEAVIATAEERAERLRSSDELFRQLAENIRDVFWITDSTGAELLYVSPAYEEVWGRTRRSLYERPGSWTESLHPEDSGRVFPAMSRLSGACEPWREEFRIVRHDGSVRRICTRIFPVRDGLGGVFRLVGVSEDITERERSATALRESEARFNAFMDNSPAVAFMKDGEGRYVFVNKPMTTRMGGHPADWMGKTTFDRLPAGVAERLRANDRAVFAGDRPVEFLETIPTPDGDSRQWLTCRFPFRDASGRRLLGGVSIDTTERLRAEQEVRELNAQLQRRLERMIALRQVGLAIIAGRDLRVTLGTALDQVTARLAVDAADVLLLDAQGDELSYAAGRGFRGDGIAGSRIRLGEGSAGRAAIERGLVRIPDLSQDGGFNRATLLEGEGFVICYAVPLVADGQLHGVLEVFHRAPLAPDPEWLEFLEALADQVAIAVDNVRLFKDLERSNRELAQSYDATIEGWARALDLRDKETEGHSRRVTEMTVTLARVMGFDPTELVHVRRGSLLHDIGKMGIPDQILLKAGPLSDEERAVMQRHPGYAHEWLSPIPFLRPALDIPYCHHEKWDGTGYPQGLEGETIPLAARIFAAVDIWDALSNDRPYRNAWPQQKVVAHIRSLAGTHLDPQVVEIFLRTLAAQQADAASSDQRRITATHGMPENKPASPVRRSELTEESPDSSMSVA